MNEVDALVREVTDVLAGGGMPHHDANRQAIDLVNECRNQKWGGPGYGEGIVRRANSGDPTARSILAEALTDGATESEFIEYYDLPGIRICVFETLATLLLTTYYLYRMHELKESSETATVQARKRIPVYGHSSDDTSTGDDRRISPVFMKRVDAYMKRRLKFDPERFEQEMTSSSTLNAHLRREIRAGRL